MEHDLREATGRLASAVGRGDAAAAAALYADDARLLAPAAEPIAGRAEIEAYWRAGIAVGVSRMQLDAHELELAGVAAIETGRYTVWAEVDRGGPVVDRGTYVVLHLQQADGSWRRAVDIFDPDGPDAVRHT